MKLPKVNLPLKQITPMAVKTLTAAYFRTYKNRPAKQKEFLLQHIAKNMHTAFGDIYRFMHIGSVIDFQEAIPVHHYDDLYPRIERTLRWEKDVLIRGKIDWFATSSWTTGKNKYIPVTKESLKQNHYRAGLDLMMHYGRNNPDTKIWQWQWLVIGWGFSYNPFTGKQNVGYISAILQKNSPLIAKLMKQPRSKISYILDRHKKVNSMIQSTQKKNITSLSGQPSWCSAYLEKMLKATKAKNILKIRPNFELVIRWGMAIDLYKDTFKRLLPSSAVHYYQVYNASEWFFAAQHENWRDDMLLFVEHAVFYEFIPFEQYLQKDYSTALTLDEVQKWIPYVIVITNNAWLRRYVLGDVIEFTWLEPHTIKIIGRTKYYIDVAWECTPLQPLDKAIRETAAHFGWSICEYTIWPSVIDANDSWYYELLIEWNKEPDCSEKQFAKQFDKLLCEKRAYYNDERHDTEMLTLPVARFIKPKSFFHWLERKGKLWWQNKIPKVSNDRKMIEEILFIQK